jgi:MFS family permease
VLFTLMGLGDAAFVVLPTAAKNLGGIASYGWLFTGALVAKIVGLVFAGQRSDSHGPRGILTAALLLDSTSVVICASAPDMTALIMGCVIRGFADGLSITAIYVVIGQVFASDSVPRVQTVIGSSFLIPSLLGPLIAGVVAQQVGWRWVFAGLVPFGLLAIALLLPVLRTLRPGPRGALRRSLLPFAVAVAVAVALLEHVGQHPPPWPLLAALASVALGLLRWGLPAVFPAGTFRLRAGVAAPIGIRCIYAGAFLGADAFLPLLLTLTRGYDAAAAALPLAGCGVLFSVGAWIQGRRPRGDEQEYRVWLVRVGFALTLLGTLAAAAVTRPSVPGWLVIAGWCLAGMGSGLTLTTFNVLVLRYTTEAARGFDSAAMQLSSVVGQAITTALGGLLVAAAARGALGFGTAFVAFNLTMAVLLMLGCATTGRLRAPIPMAS